VSTCSTASPTAEDYYVAGKESSGEWLGHGAIELGLRGTVAGSELRRVLRGSSPTSDEPLRQQASAVRVAGFDLTFSAPKSVSVLFGLGDEDVRQATRAAHDVAVREAFAYVERSASFVRRGRGGATVESAGGLVAGASAIAPRAPAIRSCTRTSWSPTSHVGETDAGLHSTVGSSTRTRGRRVSSTKPCCAAS
jgi:conjugative relaxase-like TrwC/TraI family protein